MRGSMILTILFLLSFLTGCGNRYPKKDSTETEITLFAGAGMMDIISCLADSVEQNMGVKLVLNFASSGTLARQIKEGMPCDLYFSASKRWMDYAEENNLIIDTTRQIPARNRLALITSRENNLPAFERLIDLPSMLTSRLSIGDPAHVPAGEYAAEALQSLGIYSELRSRLLPAKDVRSALMVVELGEADLGIVYKTDALQSNKVDILVTLPDSLHTPIIYHAAVVQSSRNKELAFKVLKYMTGAATKKLWKQQGFEPLL